MIIFCALFLEFRKLLIYQSERWRSLKCLSQSHKVVFLSDENLLGLEQNHKSFHSLAKWKLKYRLPFFFLFRSIADRDKSLTRIHDVLTLTQARRSDWWAPCMVQGKKKRCLCPARSVLILCIIRSKRVQNMHAAFEFANIDEWNLIEKYAISTELSNVKREKHKRKSYRVCGRDRKPWRIPIQSLKSLGNKSRKVREFVYTRILSCIRILSTLHCYVNAKKKLLNKTTFKFNCRERIRRSIRKMKYHGSRYLTLLSCNELMCSCKSKAYVANYCNYKLSRGRKNFLALRYMLA